MTELAYMKELMLIKPNNYAGVLFAIIISFLK